MGLALYLAPRTRAAPGDLCLDARSAWNGVSQNFTGTAPRSWAVLLGRRCKQAEGLPAELMTRTPRRRAHLQEEQSPHQLKHDTEQGSQPANFFFCLLFLSHKQLQQKLHSPLAFSFCTSAKLSGQAQALLRYQAAKKQRHPDTAKTLWHRSANLNKRRHSQALLDIPTCT